MKILKLEPKDWELRSPVSNSKVGRAFSPSNIAVAKYWGKRDKLLNLPTNSSLSATLDGIGSFTTVEFSDTFSSDELILNREVQGSEALKKVKKVLDLIRKTSKTSMFARVQSANNFPTAAGLASSASGLSAVTLAAANALELKLSKEQLSVIARQGSGSACRSFWGGFVKWNCGHHVDGSDSHGVSTINESDWPLGIHIAVVSGFQKDEASTSGMELTKNTSPYFKEWCTTAEEQTRQIEKAVLEKDFEQLSALAESNCIRMHASAMAAEPPIIYWQAKTLEIMHLIKRARKEGLSCFFTIDAGPNVVVFHSKHESLKIKTLLSSVEGIDVIQTQIGNGAHVL